MGCCHEEEGDHSPGSACHHLLEGTDAPRLLGRPSCITPVLALGRRWHGAARLPGREGSLGIKTDSSSYF